MDISHPFNQKILAYLAKRNPDAASTLLPEQSARDPFMHLGSHPDIVERVWKGIGSELGIDCRLIVCGTPALVQPQTGILLAIALGTQYCLHLPEDLIQTAIAAGTKTTTKWANGKVLDVAQEFGNGWVFGKWLPAEIDWCKQAFELFGLASQ